MTAPATNPASPVLLPGSAHAPGVRKRQLGSFYTCANPFLSPAFTTWAARIPADALAVEPFAGTGNLVRLAAEAGFVRRWTLFDVDESVTGVIHADTLKEFPSGFDVTVTNPPYLSWHFARRKGVEVDRADFGGYPSLYLLAIERALAGCRWAAFVIPESFLTTGLHTSRLQAVVSLGSPLFTDTEVPVCLALFGPEPTSDFEVWHDSARIGTHSELSQGLVPTECGDKFTFNRVDGQIGLVGVDNTCGPSIRFTDPSEIDAGKVKPSARLVSRIWVDDTVVDAEEVIRVANEVLRVWRDRTADVLLTAFKGLRSDGRYRRRLDYVSARSLLSQAYCQVAGHDHEDVAAACAA